MDGYSNTPLRVVDTTGQETERARAAAAIAARHDAHRFTDAIETALTGVVITGVLLFGAALLRDAVPACQARLIVHAMLVILAVMSGGVTVGFLGRAIFGR
jgi:nucleoid-associated protein YgaU